MAWRALTRFGLTSRPHPAICSGPRRRAPRPGIIVQFNVTRERRESSSHLIENEWDMG